MPFRRRFRLRLCRYAVLLIAAALLAYIRCYATLFVTMLRRIYITTLRLLLRPDDAVFAVISSIC